MRKTQLRDYLMKQVLLHHQAEEKKQREAEFERDLRDQDRIWKNETDQYKVYVEKKKKEKVDNLDRYRVDLDRQIQDKHMREAEMAALSNRL